MNRLLIFAAALCCVAAPIHGQDAAARSAVYEVSEVDSMPRPTNIPAFRSALQTGYPPALLQAGRGGRVLLSFVVAADGSVGQTRVVESTDSAFDAPSLASVAVLRWTPGSLGGSPVATRVELPVVWTAPPPPAGAAVGETAAAVDESGAYELKDVDVQPHIRNTDELRRAMVRLYPSRERVGRVSENVRVQVRFRIDAEGVPGSFSIVRSPNPHFNQPSMEAMERVRFRPAQVNGRNVPVWAELPLVWQRPWVEEPYMTPSNP